MRLLQSTWLTHRGTPWCPVRARTPNPLFGLEGPVGRLERIFAVTALSRPDSCTCGHSLGKVMATSPRSDGNVSYISELGQETPVFTKRKAGP